MTLESDVRVMSGTGDTGLIFRATNLGTSADAMNGYYVGIRDSTDQLLLGRMNGTWSEITTASVPIQSGVNYRMKVVAAGPDIRVYIDDMAIPKLHVHDATWSAGAVGVRAHFASAAFDNLSITR